MKSLKNKKWPLLLVPVISAFLFVTIITAAPLTVTGDLHAKELQATVAVTPEVAKKTVEPQTTVTTPPSSTPSTNTAPSTPTKQKQAQPTRSISTPTSSSVQPTKESAIIATAKQYIGVPYLYGGTTPAGFDCSGFVQYVFAKHGISLPRVSRDQFRVGTSVSSSNLKPGDLVFFSLAKNGIVDHEGIYIGNNQFINAASSKGVTIYTLGPYWQSVYVGAKRVL